MSRAEVTAAGDIEGVYAIIPTPANEGADHWSATNTVNVEETVRLVNQLVEDGVAGIMALGTTGECATLTDDEYEVFVDAILRTVDGRIPTFIGGTTLGTHETVRRLRFARERGASGTLLGLPMWQPCTEEMAVRFYASISEALPDLAIMVYANVRAFRFDFPPSFWGALTTAAPTVIAAKFGAPNTYLDSLAAVDGKINLLPIEMAALHFDRLAPGSVTAVWSTAASMGPQPCLALMDAFAAKDATAIEAIHGRIAWANETFAGGTPEFGFYNIQLEKLRMAAAGYCVPGPIRPPYDIVPDHMAEGSRICGERWAELVKEFDRPR